LVVNFDMIVTSVLMCASKWSFLPTLVYPEDHVWLVSLPRIKQSPGLDAKLEFCLYDDWNFEM